jgi:lipopolysaccharide transport system ATP-binding protein
MSDIAIKVENLSKQYKIPAMGRRHDTLKDTLTDGLKSIFRRDGQPSRDKVTIWALKNVSFEVKKGEILGIIGSNGAGKSTLLKILSRITKPSGGQAEIYGAVGSLLEVGTGFSGELSGRENIYMNGAILGMKKAEIDRKFDEIVSFAGVEKFVDTPVKWYSSGMFVRLAFAVAAHLEPEILFVDEVLAVGDASFQKKCLGKMGDIAKEGRTILFVSHNMIAINSLCMRAIWLNAGEIIEDGGTGQVVARYLAESVKGTGLSEEVWDDLATAPGNDMVRLHRVRIRPQNGRLAEPLTKQTPFLVEVEYWNLVADAHLHVGLHLYTAEGLIAFTTGSPSDRPMAAGLFRSVCYFPSDLLNSGQHHFVVLVVKDRSSVIYSHESRVSFDILDMRERKGTWYGKEPGVVQPKLKWVTEYLGGDPKID